MKFSSAVLLLTLATTSLSQYNPLKDHNICGRPTCVGNNKFRYQVGTEHVYKYSVYVSSLFNGTSKNESTLNVEGYAKLNFLTPCDGLLTLTDVKLSERSNTFDSSENEKIENLPPHPNNDLFSDMITENTVRFSFNDGVISEVCPQDNEKNWVLNFKKGLLSMLHNTMKRFDLDHSIVEEDVRGRCNTKYTVKGPKNTSLIIEKTKDLSNCQSRSKLHSMVQSTSYHFKSDYEHGTSLLKSNSYCILSIDHHIYNSIECNEEHIFQPFSNRDAGATTLLKQKLILVDEIKDSFAEKESLISIRTPLLYDHVPTPKPTSGELKASRNLIKKLCKLSTDTVQTEFSDAFTQFIHTSRVLSRTALSALYAHAGSTCPTGKKHMLDALPYIKTGAAVSVMKDAILNNAVTKSTINEWMLLISFISRPDDIMMDAMAQLLKKKIDNSAITLSVSALTHTYCMQNEGCRSSQAVDGIIQLLEDKVTKAYRSGNSNRDSEENIITGLKGLSNIGEVSESFKEVLINMVEDKSLDIAIRVTAIETHRRFPCEESRQYFEKLFRNLDLDPEIRIAAYLQVMRCPNYVVMRTVRHTLETEEVNQVGSFVWSHLNNLLKSSIPSRVEIQGLLSDKDLLKKFSSDVRKFSHNHEGSIFFEEYDAGANYESNVIFSPSSYVPKSVMLNLTVDLFGESINLLEVYCRMEGFEHYLESIFGPKGPLSSRKLQDKIPKMRWARSVPTSENDILQSQIDKLPNIAEDSFHSPKLAAGMKVFGNDLKYSVFDGEEEIRTALNALNPIDHLKRILSGKEITYNKAAMFLDGSYIVPSGAGLPLTLNAIGTTSINFKMFGSLKSVNFIKTKELDLVGKVSPSVSINIIGTMSVDAYFANTAIKVKTNLYTSSAVEGKLKIRGTKLVSVEFGVPQKTMEIFGAKSELIVMKGNVEERQSGMKKNFVNNSLCSWPAVEKTIGLKLCTDYYFANVTNISNATNFILASPAGIRVHVQKTDPTVKKYLLEYKWITLNNFSVISLTFDTPESNVRRLLSTNFTIDTQSQNLTLLLQSSAGTVLAKGKYKNSEFEKYLRFTLDINNNKHFDADISLNKTQTQNGFIYYPKFYVGVNQERVVELQGSLRKVEKKNVSQYDVDLKFRTKRVTSKLFGYISRTEASIASNLKLDYKFPNAREQRVVTQFSLANRSSRTITAILGDFSFTSTAYPDWNFDSTLKFQKGNGHTECKLELNSNPLPSTHPEVEFRRLTMQMLFSYRTLKDSTRFNMVASVSRQSTELDLGCQFSYDLSGPDTNSVLVVRYAKDKDIVVTVFWSHPHGALEHIEARLNITIPSFTPMILEVKFHEKFTADYIVEINATWFSGHSITARGIYQDKCTDRVSSHHLKLLLKSPSFQEINTDCLYYRDNTEFKVDLKADHIGDQYAIFWKHTTNTSNEISTEGRLKYKTQLYSITSSVQLKEERRVSVELHIDQYRDIHFEAWGYNKETNKAAGFEIKWDANRDPNQKLAVTVDFYHLASYNYSGNFMVSYPGRIINGAFYFNLLTGHISTMSRISWSTEETLAYVLTADYKNDNETSFVIHSEFITPFDEWKKTSLNGKYQHHGNMYHVNGSLYWLSDQHIAIDFFEDYELKGNYFKGELRLGLMSTVNDIPTLSGSIKHCHNTSIVDTNLRFMYHPEQIIAVNSIWHISENHITKNLTGAVTLTSPFNGYNKGVFVSKIYVTNKRYLRGIADLDLDHKKYTASVEGYFYKITKSMFVFNVTTPIDKLKELKGRFGISEERKHIVAEILHPTGSIGFEVLFNIKSLSEFDVKLSLGTPIEFLQKILILGKLESKRADFRLAWNSLLVGFVGVWHYANITDLEYSYKIYTPIEGFEENGVVAKLIYKEGLDFELSINFATDRLGITIAGKNKPKVFKELGIKAQAIYVGKLASGVGVDNAHDSNDDDDEEYDENEYEEGISWTGLIEIDALIYPTMKGSLDIDQKGTIYVVLGTLTLPDGTAELKDEFDFIDLFTMKNKFYLNTPYQRFKQVISNYEFELMPGHKYLLGIDFDYQNSSNWIKTGALVNYNVNKTEDDVTKHKVQLHVHTPFETIPRLDVLSILELEENIYRTQFAVKTTTSNISVDANAEIDEGLLDTDVRLYVKTPLISIPPTKINFKKDFSEVENLIEFRFDVQHSKSNKINFDTRCLYKSMQDFDIHVILLTPFRGMEKSELGTKMNVGSNKAEASMIIVLHPMDLRANASLKESTLKSDLTFEMSGKRSDVALFCTILSPSVNRREIQGTLNLKGKVFIVHGRAELTKDIPTNLNLQFEPEEGGEAVKFDYQLQPQPTGYALLATIKHSEKFAHFEAHTNTRNKFDWDLHLKIETSHHEYKTFTVKAKAESNDSSRNLLIEAQTPITKLENPRLGGSLTVHGNEHQAKVFYEITNSKGSAIAIWTWLVMENMSVRLIGNYLASNYTSKANVIAFYFNPNKTFNILKVGADINLNKHWSTGGNLTLGLPEHQKINAEGNLKLPPPNHDIHTVRSNFHAGRNLETIVYLIKYHTKYSKKNYGSSGNIIFSNNTRIMGNLDAEWGEKRIKNFVDFERKFNTVNLLYKLNTPKFVKEETFVTKMSYSGSDIYHNVTCKAFYPASNSIAFVKVDFQEFANMNGTVNVTTPIKGLNYTGAHFTTQTNKYFHKRYIELFWPNNTALLNSKCVIKEDSSLNERDTKGQIVVEVPLTTRHIAHVNYDYNEKPQLSTGQTIVDYNGDKVLEGKYNCLSESRAGFDKDTIHVELENKLVPVGADYFREFEYGAPRDGSNTPTVSKKRLDLYNLYNRTKFNVTGKMDVRTTLTGRQITLSTTHSNRTVKFWADYDVLDKQYKQHSRLELEPTAWIEFDFDVLNKTMDETFEAQQIQINVSYPRRNFTAFASYNVSDSSLSSDMSLVWDKERKSVEAVLDWKRDESHPNRHQAQLQIKHPSFQKDVSLRGEYESAGRKIASARLTVDYSPDPEQTLKLEGDIDNNCDRYMHNYTYNAKVLHPQTKLDLNMRGGIYWRPRWYNVEHLADYKRSYLPLQSAESSARIDFIQNEIKLKKKNLHGLSYFWGRYAGKFPLYTANVSAIHGENINASGEFYLNFIEKLVQLELNMTTDGSQSLHMYGIIPDARSAIFNIWRDYEDIRVSDVAYLLRLNHSRLLVSSLHWRPDLKQSIQNGIRAASVGLYNNITESMDEWKQYIRSEVKESIDDIWKDAKPLIQNFLDDVKDLKVIEEDLEELRIFLNNSYYANEFYIRDLVSIVVYVFDELSIKSHIENLPAIVSEIWEVMGDSGKKIQKSILWVIEKIKFYYKNVAEFINGLVQGDPVEHLSEAFKQLVEKYDNFIKDMHVAFIRYMEQLWKQTYALMLDNWHKTLIMIEPTFLKIIHYLETIVWNTSKEFLDFLYIRKNEIIEHPYFNKFSNFTQDLDRFYRDMSGNNTVVNVIKYAKVVWKFLKEKYFKLVPFSKELEDVITEIINEITELKNLPSIKFLTEIYDQMYGRLKWFYEYFDIENRLHRFITLIHLKLTDMKQTALQAENRYREAKTKFIFEPADGIMDLEQKLPIPWHAFNETPIFREIPEYKSISDLQNYFVTTRTSFWNFYYDYKPFTDPTDWFPPFNEQAMLVGTQYYVTFDRTYYDFKGGCSYLLASDFIDRNFSVVISYSDKHDLRDLLILVNNTVVRINVYNDTVNVGNSSISRLPMNIGDAILYQDADIVTLDSASGFLLQCNMKFDICMFEVSGWYFGKTAGLWGTMNNEPSDDLLTSDRQKVKVDELKVFTESWSLDQQCSDNRYHTSMSTTRATTFEVQALCKDFFSSKVSPFVTCFPRISNEPFLSMCLNSTSEDEACMSAVAYMNLCAYENTPLRIPDACVKCNLLNGSVVSEGEFVHLEGDDVPQSADVVFIVEAKECNADIRNNRSIDSVLESLDRELITLNITKNRYAVVIFGGDGVFNHPRSIVINNRIFADERSIPLYFDHFPTGKGNTDIFSSIIFASKLLFRPGVSKNFILLPCSDCHESNMRFDYAILHQLLLENDITLHILMNEEFVFQKTRVNKIFFGIDRTLAYTKKDIRGLKGDTGLRRQVRLPKSTLGFCTPLALETNGSVFTAKKLEMGKQSNVKKFATVFAKRVASTSLPTKCMMCECTAPNTGVPYMECFPCEYPTRATIDYGFDEDEALSVMQPGDEDLDDYE